MSILDSTKGLEPSPKYTIADFAELIPVSCRHTYYELFCEIMRKYNFYKTPASTHNYSGDSNRIFEGGLMDHSMEVTNILLEYTKLGLCKWDREISPYLIGMFHDLCKAYIYQKNNAGVWEHRKDDALLTGHGDLSIILLGLENIELTEQEMLCIRWHMGAYEGEKIWSAFGNAIAKYPEVLYVHTADMVASKIRNT